MEMGNPTIENIVSKVKKVAKKPVSKYCKKILIIVNKQRRKLMHGESQRSRSRNVTITRDDFVGDEKLLNLTTSSTVSSRICQNSPAGFTPLHFRTSAIIEPVPAKFRENPRDSILDACITDDLKQIVTDEKSYEDQSNQSSDKAKNSKPVTTKDEVDYENLNFSYRKCPTSLYCLANGYDSSTNWNRSSLFEESAKVFPSSCPPKKPARLNLKTNSTTTISLLDIPQPSESKGFEEIKKSKTDAKNTGAQKGIEKSVDIVNNVSPEETKYLNLNDSSINSHLRNESSDPFKMEAKIEGTCYKNLHFGSTEALAGNSDLTNQKSKLLRTSRFLDLSTKHESFNTGNDRNEAGKMNIKPRLTPYQNRATKRSIIGKSLDEMLWREAEKISTPIKRKAFKKSNFNTSKLQHPNIQNDKDLEKLIAIEAEKISLSLDRLIGSLKNEVSSTVKSYDTPEEAKTDETASILTPDPNKSCYEVDNPSEASSITKSFDSLEEINQLNKSTEKTKMEEVATETHHQSFKEAEKMDATKILSSTLRSGISSISSCYEVYSDFVNGLTNDTRPKDVTEKFVVNVFESRQSKRWKRQILHVGQDNDIKPIEMIHQKTPEDRNEKLNSTKDEIFFKMKKTRDIECGKMKEASNALWAIRNSPNRSWNEALLAESILLETELRYKSIVNTIRDTKVTKNVFEKPKVSGTLTLSNFHFEVLPQDPKKNVESTTFFLLAVSHNTEVLTTKAIQASDDNKLIFNETFSLKDLDENFKFKAELYSVTFRTAKPGFVEKLLKRKSKCCYPINKIYFENVNTFEVQESEILKPSFKSCGELTMTKQDLQNSLFLMEKYDKELVKNVVTASLTLDKLELNTKCSGFLTLGTMDEDNNIHYWERKWCSLSNKTFSIYNYPQDEEFDKSPAAFINLEYCFIPVAKNPKDCPRKRTFVLKTGRPRSLNESTSSKQLKRKNNFVLNKFYLSADNSKDFLKWTDVLDTSLEELVAWGRLVFKDEYYV